MTTQTLGCQLIHVRTPEAIANLNFLLGQRNADYDVYVDRSLAQVLNAHVRCYGYNPAVVIIDHEYHGKLKVVPTNPHYVVLNS